MKIISLLACLMLSSCANRPLEDTSPLDRPEDLKDAYTLHEENIQEITSNPAYRIKRPVK